MDDTAGSTGYLIWPLLGAVTVPLQLMTTLGGVSASAADTGWSSGFNKFCGRYCLKQLHLRSADTTCSNGFYNKPTLPGGTAPANIGKADTIPSNGFGRYLYFPRYYRLHPVTASDVTLVAAISSSAVTASAVTQAATIMTILKQRPFKMLLKDRHSRRYSSTGYGRGAVSSSAVIICGAAGSNVWERSWHYCGIFFHADVCDFPGYSCTENCTLLMNFWRPIYRRVRRATEIAEKVNLQCAEERKGEIAGEEEELLISRERRKRQSAVRIAPVRRVHEEEKESEFQEGNLGQERNTGRCS